MGLEAVMSDTLDRLKALSDKLEVKLASKTDIAENVEAVPSETVEKTPQEKPEVLSNAEESVEGEHAKLAERIIAHMSIDPKSEAVRAENIYKVAALYLSLNIKEKAPDFDHMILTIFLSIKR